VPLAAAEIGSAALALPLAFIQNGDDWTLAAVLGFEPDRNLFVDVAGTWHARYIPAAFRAHPFLIGSKPGGEATLCIDESSGLVGEGIEGEPFFQENGEVHPNVARVSGFLSETVQSEAVTIRACDALQAAGVIEAWPITLQGDQGVRQVEGLYRVSEAKLNALDATIFSGLRTSGALTVAYAQLLSMTNINLLGNLAREWAQAEAQSRAAAATDRAPPEPMIHLPSDNTIDWDWSKIGR
jgi:hypothetical protein